MKKILLHTLCLAVFCLFSVNGLAQEKKFLEVGEKVPDFRIELLDGSVFNLSELEGRVVVLNFWATWCPYCIEELKYVQEGIVDRFGAEELVFIAISRGEKNKTVYEFARNKGYDFLIGLDQDESIFNIFADKSIPRNFIIDRQGILVASEIGYTEELFAELQEKIEETLKK